MEVAGLGRTAFYRYFPDLESVVLRHMAGIADRAPRRVGRLAVGGRSRCPAATDAGRRIAAVYRDHGRLMQAFSDAAGAGPDVQGAWRAGARQASSSRAWRHLDALIAAGRAECDHPGETIRALSVLIDRYLLDIYGTDARVDIEEPVAVLVQIWRRTLRLR